MPKIFNSYSFSVKCRDRFLNGPHGVWTLHKYEDWLRYSNME